MNNDYLKGTAKKVEGSVESTYGEATGNDSERLKGMADKAQGKVLNVFGKVEDTIEDLYHTAEERAESLKSQIKARPVPSSLIALAIGFVIGRFFW